MDRYQVNDKFELTEDLRKIFEKARRGGWDEDDVMDAIHDALGETGYNGDGFLSEDDGS